MQIINTQGERLYLTSSERVAFLKAASQAPRDVRTFCLVLHYTGCRISEALGLSVRHIDLEGKALIFETLKKRRKGIFRAVPIPDDVLDTLDMVHGIREAQRSKGENKRLFSWSRSTAWRRVSEVMDEAGISEGAHRCPKGLRHGYGVHAINSGVPLNMLSKWMGHSSLEVTAIYANALGEEQRSIAAKMWEV